MMMMPRDPVVLIRASFTLDESATVRRSLVAQQSTPVMLALPPRPLVMVSLTGSAEVVYFAAFFAFTSAFVYSLVSSSSSSRPGVLKLNFLIRKVKMT